MNVLLAFLALTLLTPSGEAAEPQIVYVQPGAEAHITLEIDAAPGLVISRKNPPQISLSGPLGEGVISDVTGEPWSDDPEAYYAHLDPLVWRVSVPPETEPRAYPSRLEADFALCDTALGICFTEHREVALTLQVGTPSRNDAVTIVLDKPDF